MLEILADIRQRLKTGDYKNEEHVRLSLVARVVQALGWDIWNPTEVYAEFKATPNEDVKKVDLALFADNLSQDAIFIECKGTGNLVKGLSDDLAKVERQLRDYNKDNTAQLAIITNGRIWRFYYCYTSGEFSSKHFKTLNLSEDDLETVAVMFTLFLSKSAVADRSARAAAENYLTLTRKQQKMQDARPEAERRAMQYPFPSLPDALVQVVAEQHTNLSRAEAEDFLDSQENKPPTKPALVPVFPATSAAPKKDARQKPRLALKSKSDEELLLPNKLVVKAVSVGERFTLRQGLVNATAYLQPDGQLLVSAGSLAAAVATPSLSAGSAAVRQQLIADGVLQLRGEVLVFVAEQAFVSANRAAEVIVARSVNGQQAWMHPSGMKVRDFIAKFAQR